MTTFFLLRHAAHDNLGAFLAGRTPGLYLGPAGLAQAERLGSRMQRETFAAIYASPRERTQQTAQAIASACSCTALHTEASLDEIDFGDWSGRRFDDLNQDPAWRQWNEVRSLSCTPTGDTMLDVQQRVVTLMRKLRRQWHEESLVLVSHADVIKTAVSYVLGLSVDAWPRMEISPASVTILVLDDWRAQVTLLNETVG